MNSKQIKEFQKTVWEHYKENGRNELPWRQTTDPYKILVSEVMLQQTQVSRVIEKYKSFLKKFPTVRALAKVSLADILKEWNGLGYNRRTKYLRDAAIAIVKEHGGVFPREYPSLRSIPGIGQYTANAVRVFAFDEPEVLLETNVRTAIIRHFFQNRQSVEDFEIEKIAAAAAVEQDPREWHSALFDYGAYLKKSGIKLNGKSARYKKQSPFEGSMRQLRGKLLRRLMDGPISKESFKKIDSKNTYHISMALQGMEREGLVVKEKDRWRIA